MTQPDLTQDQLNDFYQRMEHGSSINFDDPRNPTYGMLTLMLPPSNTGTEEEMIIQAGGSVAPYSDDTAGEPVSEVAVYYKRVRSTDSDKWGQWQRS